MNKKQEQKDNNQKHNFKPALTSFKQPPKPGHYFDQKKTNKNIFHSRSNSTLPNAKSEL